MKKLLAVTGVGILLAIGSIVYALMAGYTWGTPQFADVVCEGFGTGVTIAFFAYVLLDIHIGYDR